MVVAVLAIIVLTFLLPSSLIVRPRWGVPILEGLLLVAVVISDPGKIDRRSKPVHALSIVLISLLVLTALWCTTELIVELVQGGAATGAAGTLLAAGGMVWLSNCIAFGLLYWELDGGGPAARAHGMPAHPDFAFPQQSVAGARAGRVATAVRRLPLPRVHRRHSVQPHGCDAAASLEQAGDDGPVEHLLGPSGSGDRSRGQRAALNGGRA